MSTHSTRQWAVDIFAGGLLGMLFGWVVAVNVVIFSGVEGGYQAGVAEIFDKSFLLGVVVLIIFFAGPVLGVVVARRRRMLRGRGQ